MTGGAAEQYQYSFGQDQYTHQKSALHLEPFSIKSTKNKSKIAVIFENQWRRQSGGEFLCTVLHTYKTHVFYVYIMHPMSDSCNSFNYCGKRIELDNHHFGRCLATRMRKAKILSVR